jgi:acetylglutamate kinase
VVACIGLGRDGRLLNVNADTFAGHLAARLQARRLVIAGTTAGVITSGSTVPELDPAAIARLMSDGTATAGMIAKLRACGEAVGSGVKDVVIVDGRDRAALVAAALDDEPSMATRIAANLQSKV